MIDKIYFASTCEKNMSTLKMTPTKNLVLILTPKKRLLNEKKGNY